MSNLKQIGLGFLQYSQDYDEQLPITTNISAGGGSSSWDVSIQPYIGVKVGMTTSLTSPVDPTVFHCPDDDVTRSSAYFPQRSYAMPRPNGTDNGTSGAASGCAPNVRGCLPIASILSPANTLLLCELPSTTNFFASNTGTLVDRPILKDPTCGGTCYNAQSQSTNGVALHSEGWDYLYADGHAKWARPEQTLGTGSALNPKGAWTIQDND